MDYKVFYRKYRPKNFNELIGQDHIKSILSNSIKLDKIAHAYIFTGPRGTGKTSTAKIFAKTLNCINNSEGLSCEICDMCKNNLESADIIEIDAASNNGVDEIRTLRDSVKIAPYNSKYKVYIIDEVHMLSNSAWNALLKTLEEPPKHVVFILATTEVNKIPETVMSRCQRFDFSKIESDKMYDYLLNICKFENLDIEKDAIQELVKLSDGCLRDALSYLDKISKFNSKIDVKLIEENFGIISKSKLQKLYNLIKQGDKKNINNNIDEIIKSGLTPNNLINDFIDYLLKLIIDNNIPKEEIKLIKEIILKLNNLLFNFNNNVNLFTLLKVELITLDYFPGNNDVNISQEILDKKVVTEEMSKKNNDNKILNEKLTDNNFDNKIKDIRINNAFVNPSKELKNKFIEKWNDFINYLNSINEFKIIGFIENSNIEVVSQYSVVLSFETMSNALIFNQNLDDIETAFYKKYKNSVKFVALSKEEWLEEKQNFINNKTKKYEYIDEKNIEKEGNIKTKSIAEDIFGEEIIDFK